MRKIVQIVPYTYGHSGDIETIFFALCDDGTLWREDTRKKDMLVWTEFEYEPLPQDELTAEEGEEA